MRKCVVAVGVAVWVGVTGLVPAMGQDRPSSKAAPVPVLASEWGVGRWIPDLELRPEAGPAFRWSGRFGKARAVVVAVTSTSCPVSGRYGPTLAALEQEFESRGVSFLWVDPVDTDSVESIGRWARELGLRGPWVRDAGGTLSKALGFRSTAEVLVVDAARTVQYRGAVDDQYGPGYSKAAPTRRHLVEALEAVLAGRPVETPGTSVPGCDLETAAPIPPARPVTYHHRISRILEQSCVPCHREGGIAPFALTSPAEVAAHAGMIRRQVSEGLMPPWFAAPPAHGPSPWLNDRSLPAADKADLLAWLEQGRPEGDPSQALRPRSHPTTWQSGEPDVVLRIPEPVEVAASGVMPYVNVEVPTGFDSDRWVQAWEVRPTAREVVHHVLVYVLPPGKDGKPDRSARIDGAGHYLAAYAPGYQAVTYPDGWAKHVPAGSTLRFQLHYTPRGRATRDQSALGLRFSKAPPRHEVRVGAVAAPIDIPPGDPDFRIEGRLPVPKAARLMSFMPHMHLRGKAYRYELERPGVAPVTLLDVPRYDFNWQLLYRYHEPLALQSGDTLRFTAWFDNSDQNPANPDATKWVHWGPQTYDEMQLGYVEYFLPGAKPGEASASIGRHRRLGRTEETGRPGPPALDIEAIFRRLDRNGDGELTPDELPAAQRDNLMRLDVNQDEVISLEEAKRFRR